MSGTATATNTKVTPRATVTNLVNTAKGVSLTARTSRDAACTVVNHKEEYQTVRRSSRKQVHLGSRMLDTRADTATDRSHRSQERELSNQCLTEPSEKPPSAFFATVTSASDSAVPCCIFSFRLYVLSSTLAPTTCTEPLSG